MVEAGDLIRLTEGPDETGCEAPGFEKGTVHRAIRVSAEGDAFIHAGDGWEYVLAKDWYEPVEEAYYGA